MDKPIFLSDLREGDAVSGFFVLKRCEYKEYEGGSRLDIELADKTAVIPGVVWDNARELCRELSKGLVVRVEGRLSSYRDMPQVRIDSIRPAAEGEYDPSDFLPSTPADVDTLVASVRELVNSISDPDLSRLALLIFDSENFMKQYTRAPGGTKWHHPYLGGLLEHSVSVTRICDFVASLHPELNRDLLVLAGLLHDVGKIREFAVSTLIEYSDEGRLEGHIVMGDRFVRNMCDRVENFPPNLRMLLSHLMLSHQGFKEFSTPVEPMIPEGFVLYYADEIDSKLNAVGRIRREARESGKTWSDFIRNLGRYIYAAGDDRPGDDG